MMRTRLVALALGLAGAPAHAQPVNDSVRGLDSCIQAARLAETMCSKIPNDPTHRVDCFAKARSDQLECLDRVLSEASTAAAPSIKTETARPGPAVDAAPPDVSAGPPAPQEAVQTDRPDVAAGSAPANVAANPSNPASGAAPADPPPPAVEAPTGTIPSTRPGNATDKPAPATDWIVSETMSPVDYSPLLTAVVRATSSAAGAPTTLAVRCRAQHIELSMRPEKAWSLPRGADLMVDYQINDRPVIRQPWMLSADGMTATYKSAPIELLESIPEGATLKVAVVERATVRHEATFRLTGLSDIRQKVGAACKWAQPAAATSSRKP
jgi:hypothetical protein